MSYVERAPFTRETRRLYKIADFRDLDVVSAPWFPPYASGTVITGMTGVGKSTLVQRVFTPLPSGDRAPENAPALSEPFFPIIDAVT